MGNQLGLGGHEDENPEKPIQPAFSKADLTNTRKSILNFVDWVNDEPT